VSPHDTEAQHLYNQLALLSNVSAASLGEHIHQGKPGSKTLRLAGEPPHLEFARRYNGCHTDRSRQEVIDWGNEQLIQTAYSKRRNIDLDTQEGRLMVGRDPRPVSIKAEVYGYSRQHIWRLEAKAKEHDRRNTKRAA